MMALQGIAHKFNEVIPDHHGENKLILSRAFDVSLSVGFPVKLVFKTHDGECIGSTADNLQLYSNDDILAFRFRFPDTALGIKARTCAELNEPTSVSIGFNYSGAFKVKRNIGGLDVMVVEQALLYEIAWLNYGFPGADRFAFACYQNIDGATLKQECDSGKLACDGAAINLRRAFRHLANVS